MADYATHEIERPIRGILVSHGGEGWSGEEYGVGVNGVTRIEATAKPGEYCYIPYVRVWKGDVPFAEFCQHRIVGVYFAPEPTAQGGTP